MSPYIGSRGLKREGVGKVAFRYAGGYRVRADAPNIEAPVTNVYSGMRILLQFRCQRGWGRLGRFRGDGRLCDQLSGSFCGSA